MIEEKVKREREEKRNRRVSKNINQNNPYVNSDYVSK